jgi:sugar phosphate permease
VGGWIAETHGWRYAYLVIGLPNLALGFFLFFFLKDAPRPAGAADAAPAAAAPEIRLADAVRSLLKPGAYYYIAAAIGVQGAVSWIIIAWMPTIMREEFQMTQSAAGFATLGCLYTAQATGLVTGGFWSDRASVRNPRARIILPALAVLGCTPLFLLSGWTHHIAFAFASVALWGLAMGFLGCNTMPMVCLVVDARYRATAVGFLNGFTSIFGGAAIYGLGKLRDANFEGSRVLTFAAIGVLLVGALLWLANLSVKKHGPVDSAA